MTLIGKIFTMLILVMSILFMAFAMMVFATHKNWKTAAADLQTKLTALQASKKEADALIQRLQTEQAREQAARRAALAALQVRAARSEQALTAKQGELDTLAGAHSKATEAADAAQSRLTALEGETKKLRDDLRDAQKKRDQLFLTVVDLTDKLNQAESVRQNLDEVNRQATEQMSQMKMVLDRNGLTPDAPSVAHIPPKVEGVVIDLGDRDLIEISIGADTALNTIIEDVDKIKESAVASQRCYVVEVMGHDCGYLALMSGLASGAERVYLPEDGITLDDLRHDVREMVDGFRHGKRLGLIVRSEHADPYYTTQFLVSLYEKEGGDLFDARPSILGHTQQGGRPSPFDRIQANRLAAVALERLVTLAESGAHESTAIGRENGKLKFNDLRDMPAMVEPNLHRPKVQRWMALRGLERKMAEYDPPHPVAG